ncbi:CoA ester lyase [Caulobacter sp.]|uniref:HpcH/HpaI aldolase/citrate lyase family protein n=1 Tax=Caulobacter sp. TaxID=78 RepID=UPI002B48FB17|nr:CoA ester lyase [Caulobacter sp.]HJV41561.1 CoA ester lyase [Caulobacter sp.]
MTPVWRSLQYVPAHVEKFVSTAHTRGADAIILDLEDSVPPDEKTRARDLLAEAARRVGQAGADVLVRINGDPMLAASDIVAAVGAAVSALVLPKVDSVEDLLALDRLVSQAEADRGMAPGATGFLVLIESARGLLDMANIAKASPRVMALNLGNEDLALDIGMEVDDETLQLPRQQMAIAAAAAGVMPIGLIGAATQYADLEAYRALARRSRRFGFQGSSCIHPSQIAILNEAFSPTEEEVARALRIVEGAKAARAEGRGAFAIDGRMIDTPIERRAERLLERYAAIKSREAALARRRS